MTTFIKSEKEKSAMRRRIMTLKIELGELERDFMAENDYDKAKEMCIKLLDISNEICTLRDRLLKLEIETTNRVSQKMSGL